MNKNEKTLLRELKEDSRDTELLSDIKKAIDPLGKLRGDPRFKAEISITVESHFFAAGGVEILPAALPAILQTSLPVYLLGLTDWYGYYKTGQLINFLPPRPIGANGWLLVPGAFGIYSDVIPGAFLPAYGDMIFEYQGIAGAVVIDAFIVVHCNNVAYGTFLNSFVSDLITLNQIQYTVPIANLIQLINPLNFTVQSLFGKIVTDSIDPRMYVTNQQFNQNISNIPITLPIDKSLILTFDLNYDCQNANFILAVQKVKKLTNR